jgi:hypothetical protein
MNVMPGSPCRVLLALLPLFLLPLAGCPGGPGTAGIQDKDTANVSVSASAASVTEGQVVTLEAYVNPTLATGTVTFYDGATAIGTASLGTSAFLETGIALLATSFSSVGPQSITVHYNGNAFYSPGTSAAMTIGVYSNQLASSSIALQASTTTPQYQTGVTLTAAVSPSSATGTVTFYNGGVNIGSAPVNGGTASVTTSFAAGGAATLHAVYSGDYNYLSSTSNSLTMNVSGPLATSTYLTASTAATAIGDTVTLTARLTPATATGAVTFYNGSAAIGTANVNAGVATLNTAFTASGGIFLSAAFAGNASWEASTSSQVYIVVSGDTPDSVVLQASPSSLVIGYSATLTATVSPAAATGTVTFYDGAVEIGSATVAGGTATFVNTFRTAGPQSLTAVYSGDKTYIASTSSPVTLTVGNPGPATTATTLTLSEYSGYAGDSVTLTANVSPAAATGQVSFYDNGSLLESVPVSSGAAAWSQIFPSAGDNSITAVYQGDATYSVSTSSAQDLSLSDIPASPSCPTDPTLCAIECPGDPTCPMVRKSRLEDERQSANLAVPSKLQQPALKFWTSSPPNPLLLDFPAK